MAKSTMEHRKIETKSNLQLRTTTPCFNLVCRLFRWTTDLNFNIDFDMAYRMPRRTQAVCL